MTINISASEAAKISALLSSKIDKYEYFTGEETLHPDQSWVLEQAKFTYYALGKALQKQTRTIEKQGQVEIENQVNRDDLTYKTGNKKKDKIYDFQKFKTIRSCQREIYNNNLSVDALEQQIKLKDDIDIFKESTKLQSILIIEGPKFFNVFEKIIFPKGKQSQGKGRPSILVRVDRVTRVGKVSHRKKLKLLPPKQMLKDYQ